MKARIIMSLLQQLVKEVEVHADGYGERELTDVKVEDNFISAVFFETRVDLDNFEFEDQTIDFIITQARFKIWINIYDEDVSLNERVEIKEIELQLESLSVEDASDEISNLDQVSEKAFEFLSDHHDFVNEDISSYVTFASLV
jgi:hypothetical protein